MSNNSQENTNPATTTAQGEKMIDMGSVYNKYKRFWWLFVLSLIACIGL